MPIEPVGAAELLRAPDTLRGHAGNPSATAAGVRRYLFTCAQNDTKLHEAFWENLRVFADTIGAQIHVSRFIYSKARSAKDGDKGRRNGKKFSRGPQPGWDPALDPYLSDRRMEVTSGLVWCGDMDISPAIGRPLYGLDNFPGHASCIFPHTRLALETVASSVDERAKFNYTTGAVTRCNYNRRKAGLVAEFHHCYGALLVEVDADGDWFARQINANGEGAFYDLDLFVSNASVSRGHRVHLGGHSCSGKRVLGR